MNRQRQEKSYALLRAPETRDNRHRSQSMERPFRGVQDRRRTRSKSPIPINAQYGAPGARDSYTTTLEYNSNLGVGIFTGERQLNYFSLPSNYGKVPKVSGRGWEEA